MKKTNFLNIAHIRDIRRENKIVSSMQGALNSVSLFAIILLFVFHPYNSGAQNLWGMTYSGGIGDGVLFNYSPQTSAYNAVLDFSNSNNGSSSYGYLTLANDGNLYGMTQGGSAGYGNIFEYSLTGSSYIDLYDFNNNEFPYGSLIQASDGNLYGMTNGGGTGSNGVIFQYTPGGPYNVLYDFPSDGSNGASPYGGLIQASDGNLYGMTPSGGAYGNGVIFQLTLPNGTNPTGTYNKLVDFTGISGDFIGANPTGNLFEASDGNLYGMTGGLQLTGSGNIFEYVLSSGGYAEIDFENNEWPSGSLIEASDGKLYGLTYKGGANNDGYIFNTPLNLFGENNSAINDLWDFGNNSDGINPEGTLMQASDGNLYGETFAGGAYGGGNVFQLTPGGSYTDEIDFDGDINFPGDAPQYSLLIDLCQPTITGPLTAVSGIGNVYSTQPGMTGYTWSASTGGTISGQGTNNVTVTWNAAGGHTVSVTYVNSNNTGGCGANTTTALNVTIPGVSTVVGGTASALPVTVCSGTNTTLSLTGETSPASYQWLSSSNNISFTNINGATTSTYTTTGGITATTYYKAIVTNGAESASSTTATVTIVANANITLQPSPVTISTGKNTSFGISPDPFDSIGLKYIWQVSADGGNSYSDISNGGIYSGASTTTLSLTNVTSGYSGNLYRCLVVSSSPCSSTLYSNAALLTIIPPQSGLWDGGTSTDWSDGTNWDDGNVPLSTTNVEIPSSAPNQPVITGSGTCNNITINPKASLSVTGTLACEGNLLIESDATGTGAFTQSDAPASVAITGTVTVQRYLSNLGYHYLASPLQSVTCNALNGFGGMTYTGGGTWYDPNNPAAIVPYPNMWRIDEAHTHALCPSDYNSWYAPATSEIMTTGLGYAINIASGAQTVSVSNPGSDLNAGTYTASVSKEAASTDTGHNNELLDQYGIINGSGAQNVGTGPTNGWHLIGNPYPSPVDWNALVNGGGVGANIGYGISFFKPTTQWTGVYGSYYYNPAHITSSSGAFNPGRYIPSMQSFFVQNNVVSTPVITFQNAYRTVTSSALNRTDEIGEGSSEIPNIALYGYKASDAGITSAELLKDKTVIMFGAQNNDFGTGKLMNTDENVPNIYSISMNQEMSIQGISELKNDLIIPVGFDVNTSGNYTINASEILNFPTSTHIYLEDLKNKVSQDLTLNPNYSFAISKGDADNRFLLKFTQSLQSNSGSAEMFNAYSNENILVVNYNNPSNAQATLSIFNILGQNVKELQIENGQLRMNPNVVPGVYMIKLVTNDKVYFKKVYIQ